jgi:hypothetical protein
MKRFDLMQQINARGTFRASKFALPILRRRAIRISSYCRRRSTSRRSGSRRTRLSVSYWRPKRACGRLCHYCASIAFGMRRVLR